MDINFKLDSRYVIHNLVEGEVQTDCRIYFLHSLAPLATSRAAAFVRQSPTPCNLKGRPKAFGSYVATWIILRSI